MDYPQTVAFLYSQLPMFQRSGPVAFKKGLGNIQALMHQLDNPDKAYRTIHIAGTNGKGSSSHTLAAILQAAGYKTGLYTSPHLKDFRERIRVNGQPIGEEAVVEFVEKIRPQIESLKPSFFEITVAMAFAHFAQEQVDWAVVEVGLGGRLDSTNIIMPAVSLITNIGWDHMDLLGDSLPKIAAEKAGIIKPSVPVVVSEYQAEVAGVFVEKAQQMASPLYFAHNHFRVECEPRAQTLRIIEDGRIWMRGVRPALLGAHQWRNLQGVLQTLRLLPTDAQQQISAEAVRQGIEQTTALTGLKGRWQQLRDQPKVFCDVGHNMDGVATIVEMLKLYRYKRLWIVWGCVKDKDPGKVLALLPRKARYFFCQPPIERALPAHELEAKAAEAGLKGVVIEDVMLAYHAALSQAGPDDLVLVGGSTFVVAALPI